MPLMPQFTLFKSRWLLPLCMAGALAGCGTEVVNPVTGKTERTVMNEQQELQAGREGHQEVLQEFGRYDDAQLQAYVDGVGQKLARQSHRADLRWTFTVLDSPEINAFALPGGYVYVTRGIMAYLDSEAELAGVMGHEIGHVTARHGAQRATRGQTAGIGVVAATLLGAVLESQGLGGATNLANQASQAAAAGYVASYSREQELQADQLGAEYLARNHYDPENMVDVIGVLKRQEQYAADSARGAGREAAVAQPNRWLASHPSNDQRLAQIRKIAAGYKGSYDDDGRTRYLRAIDGMIFGDSASQGLVRGADFYHPALGIALTAPPGFEVQNSPQAVALVNAAGDAALLMQLVPPQAGRTRAQVLDKLVGSGSGRTQEIQLNGLPATHYVGTLRDSQGQTRNVELSLVSGPGGHHYLLLHAARDAAARQRAAAALRQAESSFRAMNAADRAAAKVWTVQVVPLPASGLAQLARSSPLPGDKLAQLKLLNGSYGDATGAKPGQLVKVVR